MEPTTPWTRRRFLQRTGSCAAHLSLMAAASSWLPRRLWAAQERFPVVAREPWGRLEQVAEGIWALVSTPMEDRTTLCNGGIIAGRSGVALVESFASDAGVRWMAGEALRLTGMRPTHVIVTHYHGDHSGGLRGAAEGGGSEIVTTPVTRDLIEARNSDPATDVLAEARLIRGQRSWEFDLGGRSVHVVPRRGHTDSDLSVQVYDPDVIFCGDLVWNHMFPNYVDATPSRLSGAVRMLRAMDAQTYVPGHGSLADVAAMDRYIDLLDSVEAAARRAMERGMSAEEAGAEYAVPEALGEWTLFNPRYFERAIGAWMGERPSR
jgi:glyoxylase-like metal-dependent hydrolase (beta-lactamase superfamily II)